MYEFEKYGKARKNNKHYCPSFFPSTINDKIKKENYVSLFINEICCVVNKESYQLYFPHYN